MFKPVSRNVIASFRRKRGDLTEGHPEAKPKDLPEIPRFRSGRHLVSDCFVADAPRNDKRSKTDLTLILQ